MQLSLYGKTIGIWNFYYYNIKLIIIIQGTELEKCSGFGRGNVDKCAEHVAKGDDEEPIETNVANSITRINTDVNI